MFSGSTCKASLHYSSFAQLKTSPCPDIHVWPSDKPNLLLENWSRGRNGYAARACASHTNKQEESGDIGRAKHTFWYFITMVVLLIKRYVPIRLTMSVKFAAI
jgi:hypothetical protein